MPFRGESTLGTNRCSGSGNMAGMSGTAGGNNTDWSAMYIQKSLFKKLILI